LIPFTQYLRPDGRKRYVDIDMPAPIEHLALQFIEAGGRYEIEELRTGEVSLTAVFNVDDEDRDIAREICSNGPPVVHAVALIVRKSISFLDKR
jgi:hypothetical protein